MFSVTYFAVFILSHNQNTHLYSFGIEWVRDIKWTGRKIRSGAITGATWTPSHGREGFKRAETQEKRALNQATTLAGMYLHILCNSFHMGIFVSLTESVVESVG